MRMNYEKAAGSNVFDGKIEKQLLDHICLGYLNYDELLQEKNKKSNFLKALFAHQNGL